MVRCITHKKYVEYFAREIRAKGNFEGIILSISPSTDKKCAWKEIVLKEFNPLSFFFFTLSQFCLLLVYSQQNSPPAIFCCLTGNFIFSTMGNRKGTSQH